MMQVHPEHSISVEPHPHSASVVQVETGRLVPWLMFCSILSGLAIAFASFTFYQMTRSERELRIMQLQVMDQNAILIREGLKQTTDLVNGPAGNYQYERKK